MGEVILACDDLCGRVPGGIDHDQLVVTRESDPRGKYHTGNATTSGPRQLFSDLLVVLTDGVLVVLWTLASLLSPERGEMQRAPRPADPAFSAEPNPKLTMPDGGCSVARRRLVPVGNPFD